MALKGTAAYALSKKYTSDTSESLGSLKGAPCTVSGTSTDSSGNTVVTLTWTGTDGSTNTTNVTIARGSDSTASVSKSGTTATITLTDKNGITSTTITDGAKGDTGASIAGAYFNTDGKMVIQLDNGTELTPVALPSAKVDVSAVAGNIISQKSDGIYASATDISGKVDKVTGKSLVSDSDIAQITTNKTAIGTMSSLAVTSWTDLVTAINALYNSFMTSITYASKKLTIKYRNGGTVDIDMSAIITDTDIDEFKNVTISGVTDGQALVYDTTNAIWKNASIDLAGTLQSAKDYTDQQIATSEKTNAIACDAKPTYDSATDTVTYIQSGETKTEENTSSWFYYTDSDSNTVQTRWISGVEFTIDAGSVDLSDYVSKTNDVTSEFVENPSDLTKIPNLQYMATLRTVLITAIGNKVAKTDIEDSVTSTSSTKVLSANQGSVLKGLIDAKPDIDDATSATTSVYSSNKVDSFLSAKLDNTTDTSNAGKAVVVDASGNLVLGDAGVQVSEETGNAITTKDDGIYVAYEVNEILQADYDALTDEEKAGKLWNITDGTPTQVGSYLIDDTSLSTSKAYSSSKTANLLSAKAEIDDTTVSTSKVYSSNKVESLLSNPNLLDNPWFTINQRGQSSYTDNGYTVDRWCNYAGAINISDNILSQTYGYLYQNIENPNEFKNKVVTLSILSKGTITLRATYNNVDSAWQNSTSIVEKTLTNSDYEVNSITFIVPNVDMNLLSAVLQGGLNCYVKAIKLELGSVSTLANDVAPNYTTELLKCQRYYQRIYSGDIGVTFVITDGRLEGTFNTKTEMRTTPSMALTCTNILATNDNYGSTVASPTISWSAISPHNVLFNFDGFTAVSSAMPVRLLPVLTDGTLVPSDSIFELSADL